MIDAVTAYFAALSPGWLYLALFLSAFVENVFPPVPGDTVVVFAAYLVGRSHRTLTGVYVSTTLGGIAGFMTLYALGLLIHPEYFVKRNFRFLPAAQFEATRAWFERYGYWIVVVNRFLSGIRSAVSIICGIYRLPWLRVLILTAVGCGLWNALLIYAGYTLGSNWRAIDMILHRYSRGVLIVLLVAAAAWLIRKRSATPPEK
jgi:membrane protein DedA with SNARE-associated domain